ncbi:MAG: nucleotide exchange factor GrpE [Rickettsiales bacterium]|jgi:molecular chaperone GrpE|nr:nucleotide exchange factor GrpE [Rickettsiales bacterium]
MKKDKLNEQEKPTTQVNYGCKCGSECSCGKDCKCDSNCDCSSKCENKKDSELIDALTMENERMNNELLRAFADMENLKKRTEIDIKNARDFTTANIVKSFVNVADNLSRAVEAYNKKPDDIAALIDGIKMVNTDFLKTLQNFGIEKIASVGEVFNPELHQAVSMVSPVKDTDDGKISEEIQIGYMMNGKVIKPALVVVYKK